MTCYRLQQWNVLICTLQPIISYVFVSKKQHSISQIILIDDAPSRVRKELRLSGLPAYEPQREQFSFTSRPKPQVT